MSPPRERKRNYWCARHPVRDRGGAVVLDARDVPAAWRRAEREARGGSFALYDPDARLIRVGVAPPTPILAAAGATAIALSTDGETLFSGHENGMLRSYDTSTGTLRWERLAGTSCIEFILLPVHAAWVAACTRAGEIWVIDRDHGHDVMHLDTTGARAIALAPDDRMLAVAGTTVDLWSIPDRVRVLSLDSDVAHASLRSRGNRERDDASDDGDETLCDDGIYLVAFSHDGRYVIGARDREHGELIVWDRSTGHRAATRTRCAVDRMATTRTGLLLSVRDDDASVQRIDIPSLALRATFATGAERLRDLRGTPDGLFALAHDEDAGVCVIDLGTARAPTRLDEFEACAYSVRAPRRHDRSRRERSGVPEHDTHVVAVPRWRRGDPGAPLSADGKRYAALRKGDDEGMVALFDLARGVPYAALAHAHAVVSVCLSHDGSYAATRDARGSVFVWTIPAAPEQLP